MPNTSPSTIQWNMVRVGHARVGFGLVANAKAFFDVIWMLYSVTRSDGMYELHGGYDLYIYAC